MTMSLEKPSTLPPSPKRSTPVATIEWEWDECTDRTVSGFSRLYKKVEKLSVHSLLLDMSKCRFLSVGGLRHILEWHDLLKSQGVDVRITGLSPLLRNVFEMARLNWILA
jgi:anti-anti-sigma regulatory factor